MAMVAPVDLVQASAYKIHQQTLVRQQISAKSENSFLWDHSPEEDEDSPNPEKKGARLPISSTRAEEEIVEWLREQIERGIRITRVKICEKARTMIHRKNFKGTSGWVASFFSRRPEAERLYLSQNKTSQCAHRTIRE